MLKYLLIAGALFSASSANAACYVNFCKGEAASTVVSIFPNGSGNVYIEPPSDKANLNCSLAEGSYLVLQADHPLFSEIYSTILSAVAMNKLFQVRIVEGSTNCRISYVRMWS